MEQQINEPLEAQPNPLDIQNVNEKLPENSNEQAFVEDTFDIEIREKKEEKIEYGEDVDIEEAKAISNIVEKQTASVKKALQETQDRLEVDTFLQSKPEFTKYKNVILKYLQHPIYSQIPVKNIANMVAANDLMKIGAEKERQAQQKVSNTKTSGSVVRTGQTIQADWKTMNKNDFESQKRRILGQQV